MFLEIMQIIYIMLDSYEHRRSLLQNAEVLKLIENSKKYVTKLVDNGRNSYYQN